MRAALLAPAAAALSACLSAPPSSNGPDDGDVVIADAAAGDAAATTLLAAFRFEQGGFLTDSSGNGHDGVCSELECPTEVEGPSGTGSAALFDGVDDLVSIESVGSGPFTVMAWLRVDESRAGALACPFNKPFQVIGRNTWQLCLRVPSADVVDLFFYATGEPNDLSVSVPMDLGTWHHVAIRWDQATKTIFWDGADVASQDGATEFDLSAIRFGSDIDGAEPRAPFPGALDDVEIHHGALAGEVIATAARL